MAESAQTCPSPASGTSFNLLICNKMGRSWEASASEIVTAVKLNNYPDITRQSLATTRFAARSA
jgi:hypothetical protein